MSLLECLDRIYEQNVSFSKFINELPTVYDGWYNGNHTFVKSVSCYSMAPCFTVWSRFSACVQSYTITFARYSVILFQLPETLSLTAMYHCVNLDIRFKIHTFYFTRTVLTGRPGCARVLFAICTLRRRSSFNRNCACFFVNNLAPVLATTGLSVPWASFSAATWRWKKLFTGGAIGSKWGIFPAFLLASGPDTWPAFVKSIGR